MNESTASDNLSAFLDGELSEAEAQEVEAALASDASLRAELEELQGVVAFLREEGPTAAPMGFHRDLMAAIDEAHPPTVSWWAWLRRPFGIPLEGFGVALAAAAVLVIALPQTETVPGEQEWGTFEERDAGAAKLPSKFEDPKQEPVAEKKVEKSQDPPAMVGTEKVVEKKAEKGDEPPPTEEIATKEAQEEPSANDTGAMRTVGYQYIVNADDPAVKLALLKVAAAHGGAVSDGKAPIEDATMTGTTEDLFVQLPASELAAFGASLRKLGVEVATNADNTLFHGESVQVRVKLQIDEGPAPKKAAPPPSKKAIQALPDDEKP